MKLWVDGDAMPRGVKDIIFRAAKRLDLEAALVANRRLATPPGNDKVQSVTVPGGPDAADDYIWEHASVGDLAITADIPLAARLVEKGVTAIDPRGQEYTEATISERLSIRDFMDQLRSTGVETGGPKPYSDSDKRAFADAFDRTLTRMLREQP